MGHQAESVHNDPSFLDTSVLQAINNNTPDADTPVCCGNTEKLTPVGTGPFKAAGDLIAFRNLLLYGEDKVGKACAHGAKDNFQTFKSRTLPRQWNLLNNIFPDILCSRIDLPLGDHFIRKAAGDHGIVMRH